MFRINVDDHFTVLIMTMRMLTSCDQAGGGGNGSDHQSGGEGHREKEPILGRLDVEVSLRGRGGRGVTATS